MRTLEVAHGGPLTTVQDLGRPGLGAFGIPEGGAMDRSALARANRLVGNAAAAPGLEFTIQGPRLVWHGETDVALALVGDREQVVTLAPQDTLEAVHLQTRARGYIAVEGGLEVPLEGGGRGTCLAGGFGGIFGRALNEGDILPVDIPHEARRELAPALAKDSNQPARLRVLPYEGAPPAAVTALLDSEWTTGDGNRAGLHLAGPPLRVTPIGMSMPTCPGAIQVTGAGQPIILLRDHPTVGGYPILAVVIQADLDACGQLRGAATVSFQRVSEEEALQAMRQL